MRFLFCLLILLLAYSPLRAQEVTATPVPKSELQNGALTLPVGTVVAPNPKWTWYGLPDEQIYFASPNIDDPQERAIYSYVQTGSNVGVRDVENMVRTEMMEGTEAEKKAIKLDVRQNSKPLFGKTFDFEYRDKSGNWAGSLATAEGHTLCVLLNSKDPKALREKMAANFQVKPEVMKAKPIAAQGFLDVAKDIPSHLLSGSTLTLPGGVITGPQGWAWRQIDLDGITMYVCYQGTSFIIVGNVRGKHQNRELIEGFTEGFMKKSDGREHSIDFHPSTLPFAGSESVDLNFTAGGKSLMKGVGYIGNNGKQSLFVLGLGLEAPSAEAEQVVRSFQAKNLTSGDTALGMVALFLGLFIIAGTAVINAIARRPMLNGANGALVVTALCMGLTILVSSSNGAEAMGRAVGSFLIPLAIFAAISSSHKKRKTKWNEEQEKSV